jgi:hypothetical protein
MRQRAGVTLTEVLVAIFVAALGLLGILALFPVGALNMAQAIKDDRTGHSAADAKNIADIWDIRRDSMAMGWPPPTAYLPYWQANGLDTYRAPTLATDGVFYPPRQGSAGPSYPVYVDPIGFKAYGPGKPLGGLIPRKSCRFLNDPAVDPNLNPPPLGLGPAWSNRQTARWFSLLDDINYADNAVPDMSAGIVQRQGRYSWSYLCYMPSASNSNVVDLSVVVYSGRSLQLNGQLLPSGETAYKTASPAFPQPNVISLTYTAFDTKPTIRKGTWVLEAGDPTTKPAAPDVHAYFYRVVNVIDPGQSGANTLDLELQTNIQNPGTASGTVIIMDNVEEVFEAGTGPATGQQGTGS